MSRRTVVALALLGAVLLAGAVQAAPGESSRARHDTDPRNQDLTASSHPSAATRS